MTLRCEAFISMNFWRAFAAMQETAEQAAVDIAAFVAIFFENFSAFKGRAFHMAGESYGVSPLHGCSYFKNIGAYS